VAWASAALGAQAAGAVFVPIYPASTAEQIAYILDHAEVRCVFAGGAEPIARLERARARLARQGDRDRPIRSIEALELDAPELADAAARDEAAPGLVDERLAGLSLDAPAQLLYTSGTSGHPKGVPLTHRNVGVNGADWLRCNAPLLAEGDRDVLWLPMRSASPRWRRRCSSACRRTGRSWRGSPPAPIPPRPSRGPPADGSGSASRAAPGSRWRSRSSSTPPGC
jgi:long-chain acyl-CoA synthetase